VTEAAVETTEFGEGVAVVGMATLVEDVTAAGGVAAGNGDPAGGVAAGKGDPAGRSGTVTDVATQTTSPL